MATVTDILARLGLSKKEAKVYMACLRLGTSPASIIAARAEVNRATSYNILESLIKKGFIRQIRRRGADRYEATDPKTLHIALDGQMQQALNEFEQRQEILRSAMPTLRTLALPYESFPKVSFVEGLAAIGNVYAEALDSENGFLGVFDPQHTLPPFEEMTKKILERANKQKAHIREIAVAGPQAKEYKALVKNPNHKIKILPKKYKFSGDYILTKSKLYLVSIEPYPVAVAVESKHIVEDQRAIFELLWSHLK